MRDELRIFLLRNRIKVEDLAIMINEMRESEKELENEIFVMETLFKIFNKYKEYISYDTLSSYLQDKHLDFRENKVKLPLRKWKLTEKN